MQQSSDQTKWDARWKASEATDPGEPDRFVLRALDQLGASEGKRSVELAAGLGRHAFELARRGYEAEAWDVSPVALEKLGALANAAELAIDTRCVDLTGGRALPSKRAFDLVVVVNFLDRGLLTAIPELLRPGGHLLFTTFTKDWPGEHPRRAEWRLAPGELAAGLAGLSTVLVEEQSGRAGILAHTESHQG